MNSTWNSTWNSTAPDKGCHAYRTFPGTFRERPLPAILVKLVDNRRAAKMTPPQAAVRHQDTFLGSAPPMLGLGLASLGRPGTLTHEVHCMCWAGGDEAWAACRVHQFGSWQRPGQRHERPRSQGAVLDCPGHCLGARDQVNGSGLIHVGTVILLPYK